MAKSIDIRVGEQVAIDGGGLSVKVTLEEKSGQRARLRFDAGPDVSIERVRAHHTAAVRARVGLGPREEIAPNDKSAVKEF